MRLINDPLWGKIMYIDSEKLQELLANIEPVEFIPVVRCKDCEWCAICKVGQHLGLDGFCSKGERKENG